MEELRSESYASWKCEFGEENIPTDIEFIPIGSELNGKVTSDDDSKVIWAVCHDGETIGFARTRGSTRPS